MLCARCCILEAALWRALHYYAHFHLLHSVCSLAFCDRGLINCAKLQRFLSALTRAWGLRQRVGQTNCAYATWDVCQTAHEYECLASIRAEKTEIHLNY